MEFKVWYHTEAKQVGFGYKTGTLRVEPGNTRLETNDGTIEIAPIQSVGRRFVSLWLKWVEVHYGERGEQQLFMGDRRVLGWAGIFGGNKAIEEALRVAPGEAPPAPGPDKPPPA